MRSLSLLLPALWLAGCDDGGARATAEYARAMAPAFQKNVTLGGEFEDVASKVKLTELDAAAVAARFSATAVPLAKDIATQAAAVKPAEPELAEAHALLVTAWTTRATAYEAAAAAWTAGDATALEAARLDIAKVRTQEVDYLDAVNAYTMPRGVAIDLYPSGS